MVRIRPDVKIDADVAVAGAGPAGAAVAWHFARAGYRVVLFEQRAFPRDKVCGDFVGPAALVEINRLGLLSHHVFQTANIIRRAAVFLNGEKLVSSAIPKVEGLPDSGLCIPRMALDDVLVQGAVAAGCELVENARVIDYESTASCVTVITESRSVRRRLNARLLIGADGSSSLVARSLRGAPPPRRDCIVAVRAYFEGVGGPSDRAELYFSASSFPGYYWLFPTGDGSANVGVGMLVETWPPTKQQLGKLLLELIESDDAIRFRLSTAKLQGKIVGWPLVTFDPNLPIVANRVLLIGDAAGLINPLNGEGIQYALQSARWVIESLRESVQRDTLDINSLARYVDRVSDELRYDMALTRLIVDLISNRSLGPLWLVALRIISQRAAFDKEYARIAGGILAGISPARDALSTRVILGTIQQALMMSGYGVAVEALRGPQRLMASTSSVTQLAARMALESAMDPIGTLTWGMHCTRDLLEFANQIALDVSKTLRPTLRPEGSTRALARRPGGPLRFQDSLQVPKAALHILREQASKELV
jgi:menaquinone-9 beta-reductase